MSDQNAGAPITPTVPDGQAGSSQQEAPLSPDQVQYVKGLIEGDNEATYRKYQGLVDSNNFRYQRVIKEEIEHLDTTIASMRDQGIDITDAQAKSMKDLALLKVLTKVPDEEEEPQGQQPGAPAGFVPADPQKAPDQYTAEAWRLMDEAGITIGDGDPEDATIVQDKSGFDYVRSVEQAIAAKKLRLGDTTNEQQQPQVFGRQPTGSGMLGQHTTPSLIGMEPGKLFDKGWNE